MVSFTGSVAAGRRVQEVGAGTVKRVALELGGKSANIVLDDADLTKAVKVGLGNCFINGGQTCTAWTRLLVPEALHDQVVELAVAQTAQVPRRRPDRRWHPHRPDVLGDPARAGRDYIERGIADGAQLAVGGSDRPEGVSSAGAYVRPTIFAGVRRDMTIAQEEIFGPVLSVMPYTDEDEAVDDRQLARSTASRGRCSPVPRSAGVEVARRMRTGQVDVNGGAFNPVAPFGGYKQSGHRT